jgi:cysteine desulfurase
VKRIYLDHNATTPVDPSVAEAMVEAMALFGNPSSIHWHGQQARAAIDEARGQVAALIGAAPSEIVFTGGGTEADNAALRGLAARAPQERRVLVSSAVEHHAVLHTVRAMEKEGWTVRRVRARGDGRVDLERLAEAIDGQTALVALMLANNETGVLQPIAEAVSLASERDARVHCDAVQAAGKLPIDVATLGVDTLALSAHKLYGPKGVGALWVRRGSRMAAFVHGGSQERNRRAGTENVPGIVGFGVAARLAAEELATGPVRQGRLRDALEARLLEIPGARLNGEADRVANTTNVSFDGIEAESLLMALDLAGLSVSTGAACAAGAVEPSHVLRAMGLPPERVEASLRFSLGRGTTQDEIDAAAQIVAEAITKQRQLRKGRRR